MKPDNDMDDLVNRREVTSLRDIMNTRFEAMDKAVVTFHADITRVPTLLQTAIANLKELLESELSCSKAASTTRLDIIDRRFALTEVRRVESKQESQRAIDQALAAQERIFNIQADNFKEAVDKSETAMTKQFDQLVITMNAVHSSINDKITTMYDRINLNEGKGLGQNWIVGIVALGVVLDVIFRLAFKQ